MHILLLEEISYLGGRLHIHPLRSEPYYKVHELSAPSHEVILERVLDFESEHFNEFPEFAYVITSLGGFLEVVPPFFLILEGLSDSLYDGWHP